MAPTIPSWRRRSGSQGRYEGDHLVENGAPPVEEAHLLVLGAPGLVAVVWSGLFENDIE